MSLSLLSIANEFSQTPGPRTPNQGDHSGQEFKERLLRPRFHAAVSQGQKLLIDLDGTAGYATSFLEEAFGGLAREVGAKHVLAVLEFKSDDDPYLVEEIAGYIADVDGYGSREVVP